MGACQDKHTNRFKNAIRSLKLAFRFEQHFFNLQISPLKLHYYAISSVSPTSLKRLRAPRRPPRPNASCYTCKPRETAPCKRIQPMHSQHFESKGPNCNRIASFEKSVARVASGEAWTGGDRGDRC